MDILGGSFRGAEGFEGPRGTVLPGRADRQLARPDGVKELDALYEMRTGDGAMLTIRNRVIVNADRDGGRYAMSHIHVTAPVGEWAWLNRRLILGTRQSARPRKAAVVVRAWLADC